MRLFDTLIPWTAEWLWYFEDWLATGVWSGGGEHPRINKKRIKLKWTTTLGDIS